jgi:hypothetical protein
MSARAAWRRRSVSRKRRVNGCCNPEPGQSVLLVVPDNRLPAFSKSPLAWSFEKVARVGPFALYRSPRSQRLASARWRCTRARASPDARRWC